MTIIRRRHDRSVTLVPTEVFADRRLSLPALGLYCWLADEARTVEAATARFGITPPQLASLLEQLRTADLIDTKESGS